MKKGRQMLRKIGIAGLIIFLSVCPARGQFSFVAGKVETIRWSLDPEQVTGLDHHVIDLEGKWKFSTEPGKFFYKEGNPQELDHIEVPGEWVIQGYDEIPGNYAGYFRTFELP